MKRTAFAFALVVLLAGCAQPGSSDQGSGRSKLVSFPACGLSVRFSGQPEEVKGADRARLRPGLERAEGSVWMSAASSQGASRNEISYCECPGGSQSREKMIDIWRSNSNHKVIDNLGDSIEFPMMDFGSLKSISKDTWAVGSSCYLRQIVAGSANSAEAFQTSALPFLTSVALIGKN